MSSLSLTNHFLIAMPSLADPNFQRTVTYICEHNDQGAMGIVINRPLNLTLGEVFEHMHIASDAPDITRHSVYMGGPVQPARGFVLHETADNAWRSGPADNQIIFQTPWQQRWEAAAAAMGVDMHQLSNQIGHA